MGIFGVLIVSLLVTLLGRTVYLQVADADHASAAVANRVRTEVVPAPRGDILDKEDRPLATTRAAVHVTLDPSVLRARQDSGSAVLRELGALLGEPPQSLRDRMTPCGEPGAKTGVCWNGVLYRPIPVARDVPAEVAIAVLENPNRFPGASTRTELIRYYPGIEGGRAGHVLGYTGPVTREEVDGSGGTLTDQDTIGRAGLEAVYDASLRGRNGEQILSVDTDGSVTETVASDPAQQGSTLHTSLDASLQAVVEQQLRNAVDRARSNPGRKLAADSGAAVVLSAETGRILAMASYPDYDPQAWVGGLSDKEYRTLLRTDALFATAWQGGYAPGSTYKPFTIAAMQRAGFGMTDTYSCPSAYDAGGRSFRNFESRGYGPISLRRALEVSCNTVFYGAADRIWRRAGGQQAGAGAFDPIADVPAEFGLGRRTGVDLPGEVSGTVSGRAAKAELWKQRRDAWCAAAAEGYPELRATDPDLADSYTELDRENCEEGFQWRQGDALNAAIGQGLTAISPLQLAVAYSALANGGEVRQPTVARRIVAADGRTARRIDPVVLGTADVDKPTLRFIRDAMVAVTTSGSAATAFAGFPLEQFPVASKTGSAQVSGGKPSTSWFGSFAPADDPRYVVVMMVTQGGTGSETSGPSVRAIYDHLFQTGQR